jgi:hypothetical protein
MQICMITTQERLDKLFQNALYISGRPMQSEARRVWWKTSGPLPTQHHNNCQFGLVAIRKVQWPRPYFTSHEPLALALSTLTEGVGGLDILHPLGSCWSQFSHELPRCVVWTESSPCMCWGINCLRTTEFPLPIALPYPFPQGG